MHYTVLRTKCFTKQIQLDCVNNAILCHGKNSSSTCGVCVMLRSFHVARKSDIVITIFNSQSNIYPSMRYVTLYTLTRYVMAVRPPLWSSGQRSRVRSPALTDFLGSSGSGTGSTQPREPREVN